MMVPEFLQSATVQHIINTGRSCKHIAAVCLKIYEHEHTSFSSSNSQKYSDLKRKQEEILKQRQQEAERQKEERQAIYVKKLTSQFIQAVSNYSQERIEEEKPKSLLMVEWTIKIIQALLLIATAFNNRDEGRPKTNICCKENNRFS